MTPAGRDFAESKVPLQAARSPVADTWSAPRMPVPTRPPRIIANEVAESKKLPPAGTVTVCFPALIKSGSCSRAKGNAPIPSMPFSLCSITRTPGGRRSATRVGIPIPRFT
jgi:hypothetical protein